MIILLLVVTLLLGLLQFCFPNGVARRTFAAAPGFGIVVSIGNLLLFLVLFRGIHRGQRWARTCFTVLFVLGVPFAVPILGDTFASSILSGLVSIIQLVFQLVALVWLYRPEASKWFKRDVNGTAIAVETEVRALPIAADAAAMGLRICSQCRTRVLPTTSGHCPSCHGHFVRSESQASQ
jgi:hypothetical protein